ncbi:MAG TPA: hypothetical protein VGK67_23215 [Myxococcales bacterium]
MRASTARARRSCAPGPRPLRPPLCFAIDDFVFFGQAERLANRIEHGEASLEVAEHVTPLATPDGGVGVSAGLVGRF